jgi:hypothetical protein
MKHIETFGSTEGDSMASQTFRMAAKFIAIALASASTAALAQ